MIITLYKVGPDEKKYYYTVHDRQPVLDAPYAICASWRIGLGREREKLHRFDRLADRDRMIRRLIASRVKDGYKILYTFSRDALSPGADPGLAGTEPTYPIPEVAALLAR
jgi:hypothetical protein